MASLAAIYFAHNAGTNQMILVSTAVVLLNWLREPPKGGPPHAVVKAAGVAFIIGMLASDALAHL